MLRHHSETQLVILRNYWSLDLTVKQTRNFVSRLKYVTIMPSLHLCETSFSFPTEGCFKMSSDPLLRVPPLNSQVLTIITPWEAFSDLLKIPLHTATLSGTFS